MYRVNDEYNEITNQEFGLITAKILGIFIQIAKHRRLDKLEESMKRVARESRKISKLSDKVDV